MKASAVVTPIVQAIELKKILYATDFSDASLAALTMVSTIARKYGSQVFVVNVCTPVPYTMVSPEAAAVLQHKDEVAARSKVRDLMISGNLAGLSTTAVVRSGLPREELMRFVRKQKIDLAILGTHGRTGLRHLLMGSVAEELVRNLLCPVLTVGPNVSKTSLEATASSTFFFPPTFRMNPERYFRTSLPWRLNIRHRLRCFMSCQLRPPRTRMLSPWQSLCAKKCRPSFLLTLIHECRLSSQSILGTPRSEFLLTPKRAVRTL